MAFLFTDAWLRRFFCIGTRSRTTFSNLPGKTPKPPCMPACYTDLKKKDVNKRVFARPSEGHFGLREWANDPELTHLLQPKLHRLAETLEEEQKPKVEKPWKQPAPDGKA